MREKLPKYVSSEWDKNTPSHGLGNPRSCGPRTRNPRRFSMRWSRLGFKGLWGYLWDAADLEVGDDRGCSVRFFSTRQAITITLPERRQAELSGFRRTSFNLAENRERQQEGRPKQSRGDTSTLDFKRQGGTHIRLLRGEREVEPLARLCSAHWRRGFGGIAGRRNGTT